MQSRHVSTGSNREAPSAFVPDNTDAEVRILSSLLDASTEISRQRDLDGLMRAVEYGLSRLAPQSTMRVYRVDELRGELECIHGHKKGSSDHAGRTRPFSVGIAGEAAEAGTVIRRPTDGEGGSSRWELAVPVGVEGDLVLIIELQRTEPPYTARDASLVGIVGAHAASALRRLDVQTSIDALYLGGIRLLTSIVDARDRLTRGHSGRVSLIARRIAEAMNLPREEIRQIEVAALLHDIGKVGIPDSILMKAAPLADHERAVMMGHAELGASILRDAHARPIERLVPLVLHHHEWWDGRGYPRGLQGPDIPIGAQIISVADAFDTITNDRPYRDKASPDVAWRTIERAAGAQFSPDVVAALGRVLERGIPENILADTLDDEPASESLDEIDLEYPGQLGDLRGLGVLVGLARITSHITDLQEMMQQTLGILADRLDISLAMVLRPDPTRHEDLEAACHTADGFRMLECPSSECLDAVLRSSLPTTLESLEHIPGVAQMRVVFRNMQNVGVLPLATDSEPAGVLMYQPLRSERYWRADLDAIDGIAPNVLAAINVARLHERAKEDALTDGLTGVMNYRGFYRELTEHIAQAEPFSLLMFDVIGLKRLNDTAGHLAGDELLQQISRAIREVVPPPAIVARIGGDEFAALLPHGDPADVAEQVRLKTKRKVAQQRQQDVAVRFGWARCPDDGETVETLVHTADQRMYRFHQQQRQAG